MIVAGLLCGAIGIWIATRSSGQSPSAPDASAPTPVSQVAAPSPATDAPSPAPEPVRSYVSVQRGSPLCGSFKGAITAESVMRSGNPTVIAMVLDRQGCEQAPQSYQFDAEKTLVQPLQAGVVQLTLADGTQIFTTQESVSTSRH
ncbi:MAG TPA: hypothetical protein VLX90_03770 [Steroidobacteraceae bacterium]|nr:hypothetical protein [Steroidobacteraceae bacterium]